MQQSNNIFQFGGVCDLFLTAETDFDNYKQNDLIAFWPNVTVDFAYTNYDQKASITNIPLLSLSTTKITGVTVSGVNWTSRVLNLLFKKDSSSVEIPFFELVSFVDGKGYAAHDNIQHVEVFDEDGTAISCKAQAHGMIELDNAATAQYRVYYTTIQNKEKYNVEAHYMPYLHLTIKGKGNENNNTGDVVIDLSKCALSYNNSWNFRGNQLNSATVAFNVIGDSWISFM